jgi:hypothetical protein
MWIRCVFTIRMYVCTWAQDERPADLHMAHTAKCVYVCTPHGGAVLQWQGQVMDVVSLNVFVVFIRHLLVMLYE